MNTITTSYHPSAYGVSQYEYTASHSPTSTISPNDSQSSYSQISSAHNPPFVVSISGNNASPTYEPGSRQGHPSESVEKSQGSSPISISPISQDPSLENEVGLYGNDADSETSFSIFGRAGTLAEESEEKTATGPSGSDESEDPPDNSEASDSTERTGQDSVTELTAQEQALVDELQQVDSEVRTHEMAHIAAGGQYVTSGAKLEYMKGPDGRNYAVAGEVSIDTSPIPGDPQATMAKMRQIQQAALAPASPSSQDRKVASRASSLAAQALSELMIQQAKERTSTNDQQAFGTMRQAADTYIKTEGIAMDEEPGRHLDVAV